MMQGLEYNDAEEKLYRELDRLDRTEARISIVRKGRFKAEKMLGKNKCGAPGQTEFWYEARITVARLDARGFVVDASNIEDYFRTALNAGYRFVGSCEQLAIEGVKAMIQMVGKDRALSVDFTVSPYEDLDAGGITVRWDWKLKIPTGGVEWMSHVSSANGKDIYIPNGTSQVVEMRPTPSGSAAKGTPSGCR